jgi:hypothetical protein
VSHSVTSFTGKSVKSITRWYGFGQRDGIDTAGGAGDMDEKRRVSRTGGETIRQIFYPLRYIPC